MKKNEKPHKVLLVEDNHSHVRLIQEIWAEMTGFHQMEVEQDGIQAMSYLYQKLQEGKSTLPHLILLDLNLPKKNGIEVLQEIKCNSILKHIPVIILTTSTNEEDIIQCYNLNANCYITKPRNLSDLLKVMQKIVDFWLETVTFYPE